MARKMYCKRKREINNKYMQIPPAAAAAAAAVKAPPAVLTFCDSL